MKCHSEHLGIRDSSPWITEVLRWHGAPRRPYTLVAFIAQTREDAGVIKKKHSKVR